MSDRTSIVLGALMGSVVGGCVAYLWFTEEGRRLREDLEPKLADLASEIERARAVVRNTQSDAEPPGR